MMNTMSNSSNASKQRWNSENYAQVKVSVKPELAAEFKGACKAAGASMASVLSSFMASYSQHIIKHEPSGTPYATRRLRRRAVEAIISPMESLALAEERYRDNIPENLQGSIRYEEAERSVDAAYEAICLLRDIY
jgi:hypothetical protein